MLVMDSILFILLWLTRKTKILILRTEFLHICNTRKQHLVVNQRWPPLTGSAMFQIIQTWLDEFMFLERKNNLKKQEGPCLPFLYPGKIIHHLSSHKKLSLITWNRRHQKVKSSVIQWLLNPAASDRSESHR